MIAITRIDTNAVQKLYNTLVQEINKPLTLEILTGSLVYAMEKWYEQNGWMFPYERAATAVYHWLHRCNYVTDIVIRKPKYKNDRDNWLYFVGTSLNEETLEESIIWGGFEEAKRFYNWFSADFCSRYLLRNHIPKGDQVSLVDLKYVTIRE